MTDIQNMPFACVEDAGCSQMAGAFFKKCTAAKFGVWCLNTYVIWIKSHVCQSCGRLELNWTNNDQFQSDRITDAPFKTAGMDCICWEYALCRIMSKTYLTGTSLIKKRNQFTKYEKSVISSKPVMNLISSPEVK